MLFRINCKRSGGVFAALSARIHAARSHCSSQRLRAAFGSAIFIGLLLLVSAQTQTCIAIQSSPTSCYQEYRTKFKSAQKVSDYSEFCSAHSMDAVNKLTETQQTDVLKMQRFFMPDTVSVLSESIKGPQATLRVQGIFTGNQERLSSVKPSDDPSKATNQLVPQVGQKLTGTVTMVLEDGSWKIDKEDWGTIQMGTTKVLSARGEALQHSDAARQSVTKYVNGNLYKQRFGLVKSRYNYVSILLDGGEIPNIALIKFRAKVIIEFDQPQNFPGHVYRFGVGQKSIATKSGTVNAPKINLCEERTTEKGTSFFSSSLGNSSYSDGYALLLNFYPLTKDGQLPGYIDLQVPGKDNTHIKGYFYATKTGKISAFGDSN